MLENGQNVDKKHGLAEVIRNYIPSFLFSSAYGNPISFPVISIFAKFRRSHPLWGRWKQMEYTNFAIFDQYRAIGLYMYVANDAR